MKILLVAGARPNFVKIAPILHEMRKHPSLRPTLVHTGQHYDDALSSRFFADLDIPEPDVKLDVGSGSHAVQTAEILRRIEPVLDGVRPELLLVVGDVNSTLASALAAAKLGIRVGHVEAGLRSFDRAMPEEVNRLLVDAISDLLFLTEVSAWHNLLREGVALEKLHLVGNVMIDALQSCRDRWQRSDIGRRLGLAPRQRYAMLTLHRPSNVDSADSLAALLRPIAALAHEVPIILPVHPRVRPQMQRRDELVWRKTGSTAPMPSTGIVCIEPLGYLDCLALMSGAALVLTDSGGIQEETTILKVPCLTLRDTTERPVTVSHGTNQVIGTDPARIVREGTRALNSEAAVVAPPPLWDGRAAERIVRILLRQAEGGRTVDDRAAAHAIALAPRPAGAGSHEPGAPGHGAAA